MENREISRRDLANRLLFHAVCSPYMEHLATIVIQPQTVPREMVR